MNSTSLTLSDSQLSLGDKRMQQFTSFRPWCWVLAVGLKLGRAEGLLPAGVSLIKTLSLSAMFLFSFTYCQMSDYNFCKSREEKTNFKNVCEDEGKIEMSEISIWCSPHDQGHHSSQQ